MSWGLWRGTSTTVHVKHPAGPSVSLISGIKTFQYTKVMQDLPTLGTPIDPENTMILMIETQESLYSHISPSKHEVPNLGKTLNPKPTFQYTKVMQDLPTLGTPIDPENTMILMIETQESLYSHISPSKHEVPNLGKTLNPKPLTVVSLYFLSFIQLNISPYLTKNVKSTLMLGNPLFCIHVRPRYRRYGLGDLALPAQMPIGCSGFRVWGLRFKAYRAKWLSPLSFLEVHGVVML